MHNMTPLTGHNPKRATKLARLRQNQTLSPRMIAFP